MSLLTKPIAKATPLTRPPHRERRVSSLVPMASIFAASRFREALGLELKLVLFSGSLPSSSSPGLDENEVKLLTAIAIELQTFLEFSYPERKLGLCCLKFLF